MTNPARQLAALLDGWTDPGGHGPLNVRAAPEGESAEFWRGQHKAVNLLGELDRAMRALEAESRDMTSLWPAFAAWNRAVFCVDRPWLAGSDASPLLSFENKNFLNLLAVMLDDVSTGFAKSLKLADLRESLVEATGLMDDISELLNVDARRYIRGLIIEAISTIDHFETYGDWELRGRALAVSGALASVGLSLTESDPTASQRAARIAFNICSFVGGSIVSGPLGDLGSAALTLMLGK